MVGQVAGVSVRVHGSGEVVKLGEEGERSSGPLIGDGEDDAKQVKSGVDQQAAELPGDLGLRPPEAKGISGRN